MNNPDLAKKAENYLSTLCVTISDRSVGSIGNLEAVTFIEKEISTLGWKTRLSGFDAIEWEEDGVELKCGEQEFEAFVSPYSLSFRGEAPLICVTTADDLEKASLKDKILLLHGDIAREQIMPKNFVFYNPEEHQRIIALLEKGSPSAIICATGRNPALAGGVYPFPMIEDGDFDIPSVYMTEEEGKKLASLAGKKIYLESLSERIPSHGYNVSALKGKTGAKLIVITAHLDAKKGSPGAIDNATGVAILLLLAELLRDYQGDKLLEIVALNGEDYYAVPGQMRYISENEGKFGNMLLNINIDGAGYHEGPTALSLFSLPDDISSTARKVIDANDGIEEGIQWPQGDHSIFLQNGVPAIAVSSLWFLENIDSQDITHTEKDNPGIVDCARVAEAATVLNELIRSL